MDTRTLTLIGASLGGIGLALLVDARKQMSYLNAKHEEAVQTVPLETKDIETEAGEVKQDLVEDTPQAREEVLKAETLLKTEPPTPELPLPSPLKIKIPKPMPATRPKPTAGISTLVTDMLPGETYADYHRRIASFASEYKDDSSEYESSSSGESESDLDSVSDSGSEPEPEPEPKSIARSPARLPPSTPRQMAPREENPKLVHRLRRATAMAEEEKETRAHPSLQAAPAPQKKEKRTYRA